MRYQFADVTVDTDARELRRCGEPVRVSGKAFDLLRLLLENRPRAMQKRVIYDHLWPATFVVEANLPVLVREVRSAIGDEKHELIRTVQRFGYAFGAPARELGASDQQANGSAHMLVAADRQVRLANGENTVGRDPAAEVFVASSTVSRRHAKITTQGSDATLTDLKSKNGTRLDGVVIRDATPLHDGSVIRFGSIEMVYRHCDPGELTKSAREEQRNDTVAPRSEEATVNDQRVEAARGRSSIEEDSRVKLGPGHP